MQAASLNLNAMRTNAQSNTFFTAYALKYATKTGQSHATYAAVYANNLHMNEFQNFQNFNPKAFGMHIENIFEMCKAKGKYGKRAKVKTGSWHWT